MIIDGWFWHFCAVATTVHLQLFYTFFICKGYETVFLTSECHFSSLLSSICNFTSTTSQTAECVCKTASTTPQTVEYDL